MPAPVPTWLRPTPNNPDDVWADCTADHPEAVPALYIGDTWTDPKTWGADWLENCRKLERTHSYEL